MPDVLTITRQRRTRADSARQQLNRRLRRVGSGCVFVLTALTAVVFLLGALAYSSLTSDLPSVETLPVLLDHSDGLLREPTRVYDRTGQHLLLVLSPFDEARQFISIDPARLESLPGNLAQATLASLDPGFWTHAGYTLTGLNEPDRHSTLAQRLVSDLLLWQEPPSFRRAVRERLLAAQVTAKYGSAQVLEWYLNSANYGRFAYGAETAARLYLGKSAVELNLAEAALLAAAGEAPALNPFDSPGAARQRSLEIIALMEALGMVSQEEAEQAREDAPALLLLNSPPVDSAPAFTSLALSQVHQQYDRTRVERGGLQIITTLEYDLQLQTACAVEARLKALAGDLSETVAADGRPCEAARLLSSLPPETRLPRADTSVVIAEPLNGQVLAAVGDSSLERKSTALSAHPSGSLLTPFIYLTGFTRGLGPASLVWDVPVAGSGDPDPAAEFQGPVRLRMALASDAIAPAARVLAQMGEANVERTARSFGLSFPGEAVPLQDPIVHTPLEIARAYAILAAEGVQAGHMSPEEELRLSAVLRVSGVDGAVWLDWSRPQVRAVVTPQLAYLVTHILSDETARWPSLGHPNALEIGRPAGVKIGRTASPGEAWVAGYTPQRVVVVWTGGSDPGGNAAEAAAGLWHGLMQFASRDLPPDAWEQPPGLTEVEVCDPSGLLPTPACPNVVRELFLNGSEPVHADNLYQVFDINRETGFLATVFTPPQLVEQRVYLIVPLEMRAWARANGLPAPPETYDTIQAQTGSAGARISAPAMQSYLKGEVTITGSAAGDDFVAYRVQFGEGLNPKTWRQIGEEMRTPVEDGQLLAWDTSGLNGLFALQLIVVRDGQRIERATVLVTVDNDAPRLSLSVPQEGEQFNFASQPQITFQTQVSDNLFLDRVEFYVDGKLTATLREPPYILAWSPTPGDHTLRVVAVDRAGNQSEQSARFDVLR